MVRDSAGGSSPKTKPAIARRSSLSGTGVALAIANTVVGSLQPIVTRWSALRLDPLLFCAGATAAASLGLVPLLYWRGELGNLVSKRYRGQLFALSMAGTVATSLALIYGLKRVNAITAVLLMQTEPVYSLLLAILYVGERPSIRQVAATATIVAGIGSVFSGGGSFQLSFGAVAILLTPLCWQVSHIVSLKVMPPLTPYCITGARYTYAAVVLATIFALGGFRSSGQMLQPHALAAIVVTGMVIYFLGSLSWYAAISRLSLTWTTAVVVPGGPLLSVLFAVTLLGERLTSHQVIGITIATSGVLALVFGAEGNRLAAADSIEAVHHPLG